MSKSYSVMLFHMPDVRSLDEHVSMFKVNMKNEAVHLVPGLEVITMAGHVKGYVISNL